MGSGKSSVGRTLARLLKRKFIDTDYLIEKEEGKSISDIFSLKGEEYFRNLETKVIRRALKNKDAIISLGGGAIVSETNRELIKDKSKLITLLASPENLYERVKRRSHRPLLKDTDQLETLKKLWQERETAYMDAHLAVDTTDKDVDQISNEIIEALNIKRSNNHHLSINIEQENTKYNILFRKLSQLNLNELNLGRNLLIVTQEPIAEAYLDYVKELLNNHFNVHSLVIENGEQAKNFFSYQLIVQKCLALKLERKDTLVALGGGVVGDITGFAASTYLRGINYIQIPTTLLSMIDSAVGGKTGINVSEGKNLVGSFYQPKEVFIDVNMLGTLPDREFKSGLGELVKYTLLGSAWDVLLGESFFSFVSRNVDKILKKDEQILKDTIEHCLQIKANIVAQDEKEKGLRAHLNLGHTFGHAIEELTEYSRFSHGEAVAIGIVCACYLAEELDIWGYKVTQRVINLMRDLGLEHKVPADLDVDKIVEAFKHDKKVQDGKVRFILPKNKIGRVEMVNDIDLKLAARAIKRAQEE